MVDEKRARRVRAMLTLGALSSAFALAGGASAGSSDLIAFTRCRLLDSCARGADIWVMRPDGNGLQRLTRDGSHNLSPSWSPDGSRIVFVSGRDGVDEIWTMKAKGSDMRQLTHPRGLDEQPAWSPDGRRIAFVRKTSASRSAIYSINADGTGLRALTRAVGDYEHPSWSPDGRRIAYSFSREPDRVHYGIYVAASNGRGEHKLSLRSMADYLDPAWSPDGNRIAFSLLVPAGKTFTAHLETMNAGGGNERAVSQAPAGTVFFSPSWSPDGAEIVFVRLSGHTGLAEISIVNSDGSRLRTLTQLLGDNRGPAWRVPRQK